MPVDARYLAGIELEARRTCSTSARNPVDEALAFGPRLNVMARPAARLLALAIAALALTVAAPAAVPPSQARAAEVGMGDQVGTMFRDRFFTSLGLRRVRLIVPWDVALSAPGDRRRRQVEQWLAAAQAGGYEPLVAFYDSPTRTSAPTVAQYRAGFQAFRAAFPWVRAFIPWNEANLNAGALHGDVDLAAGYRNEMTAACPGCTVLGGDIWDASDMEDWVRSYLARVRVRPTIWGLHPYGDVTNSRPWSSSSTRKLLALSGAGSEIWFTEIGGVRFVGGFYFTEESANRQFKQIFTLANSSPAIRRVYLYHWRAGSDPHDTWDSGLLDANGRPRTVYWLLREQLGLPGMEAFSASGASLLGLPPLPPFRRGRNPRLRVAAKVVSGRVTGTVSVVARAQGRLVLSAFKKRKLTAIRVSGHGPRWRFRVTTKVRRGQRVRLIARYVGRAGWAEQIAAKTVRRRRR